MERMADQEAKLNLVITARDDAKAVIAEFASGLKSIFEGLQNQMKDALNMNSVKTSVEETVNAINRDLEGVNVSAVDQAFKEIQDTVYMTRSRLEEEFNAMKQGFGNESLAATEAAQMTSEQMRNIVESATGMRIQVVEDFNQVGHSAMNMADAMQFQNLQMAGQQIQQMGQGITGFFANAVQSAADFDQNIVNTTASLNANMVATKLSTQQIDAMRQAALQMGQDGFFSANEIADAMNTMAKQGIDYQTIMKGGIAVVKNVAAANQQDLEQTANVVSDIYNEMGDEFKAAGLNAQQAAQMIGNSMTVALHHARISMDDFMNTMKYVGSQASAAGVSIKDVSAAIALLGEHGIRGSQAGTTLRRMLTNLTPQSKEAAAMMEKLGMVTANGGNIFYDASGKMKPLAEVQQLLHDKLSALTPEMQQLAIKTIFGQYALSGMTAIVNTSTDKFQELTQEMNNNNLMTDILNEKSQGLQLQLQKLNAHWQTMQKSIGEMLKPVIEWLIGGLTKLMNLWENLSPSVQKGIVIFAAVAGVVLTLGGAFLALVGTIGMMAPIFADGFAALGTAAAPIEIVVAAIAGLVAAILLIKKAWDANLGGIQQKTKAVFEFVTQQFDAAMKVLSQVVGQGIKAVMEWWKQMAPTFGQAIHNIYAFIVWLKPLWEAIWAVMKFTVGMVFDSILDTIKNAFRLITGMIDFFADLFAGNWKKLWDDVWQILTSAVGLILDVGFGRLFKIGSQILGDLGKFIFKWLGDVAKNFKGWADSLGGISGYIWKLISGLFQSGMNTVATIWKNGWSIIQNIFGAFKNLFTGNINGFWSNINGIFRGAVGIVSGIMRSFFDAINSIMGGLPARALQWAQNMMDMFIQGIESKLGAIGNAINGVANKIKSFLGFHSPTKEGAARAGESDMWMPNMMSMFEKGILENTPKIEAAVGKVALGIKTGITATNSIVHSLTQPTPNVPPTNNRNQDVQININIDGRSAKTDNDLAETIAKKLYTQMSVVS